MTTNELPDEETPRLQSVCPQCGAPFERDDNTATCPDCQPVRTRRPSHAWKRSPRELGYDAAWDRLSRRARRLSPVCEDCGSTDQLSADHSPEAWKRKAAGLSIRLRDISVVCLRCNAERGAARGELAFQNDRWSRDRTRLDQLEDEFDRDDDDPRE